VTRPILSLLALLLADQGRRPGAAEVPPPASPSLGASALRDELARRNPERERVEALLAELARTREALRAETARLEALVQKAAAASPAPGPAVEPRPPGQVELVSRALRGMPAPQAAAIIGHLDRALAAEVLVRMRPAEAGAILGFTKPELAAALATDIASRPAAEERPTRVRRKPEQVP
jgi:flagellar motility protein MotE (MotC chaperone)